jgi:hypothetical protein
MPYIIRPRSARSIVAALSGSAILACAAPAMASAACPSAATSKAFAPFGDQAYYTLLQNGTFENGAGGWAVNGGEVIADEDPVMHSRHALAIKPNGHVESPTFCVSAEYPTFRFRYRLVRGGGKMNVGVRYTDSSGETHETIVDALTAESSWTTSPVEQLASVLPLTEVATQIDTVQLVFTDTHPGLSYAVSNVYIDPYSR